MVKMVEPPRVEVAELGGTWGALLPNLCGEMCPPSYKSLKIIVNCGNSLPSGS